MGADLPEDWEQQFSELSDVTGPIELERPFEDLTIMEIVAERIKTESWLKANKQFIYPKSSKAKRLHLKLRDLALEFQTKATNNKESI